MYVLLDFNYTAQTTLSLLNPCFGFTENQAKWFNIAPLVCINYFTKIFDKITYFILGLNFDLTK